MPCTQLVGFLSEQNTAFYLRTDQPGDVETAKQLISHLIGENPASARPLRQSRCFELALISDPDKHYHWMERVEISGSARLFVDGQEVPEQQVTNDAHRPAVALQIPRFSEKRIAYIANPLLLSSFTGSVLANLPPADRLVISILKSTPPLAITFEGKSLTIHGKQSPRNALSPAPSLLIDKPLLCDQPAIALHIQEPINTYSLLREALSRHDPALRKGIEAMWLKRLEDMFGDSSPATTTMLTELLQANTSVEISHRGFVISGSFKPSSKALSELLDEFASAHPQVTIRTQDFLGENRRTDVLIESGAGLKQQQMLGWQLKSVAEGQPGSTLAIATNRTSYLLSGSGTLVRQAIARTCDRLAAVTTSPIDPTLMSTGRFDTAAAVSWLRSAVPFLLMNIDHSKLPWQWPGQKPSIEWQVRPMTIVVR